MVKYINLDKFKCYIHVAFFSEMINKMFRKMNSIHLKNLYKFSIMRLSKKQQIISETIDFLMFLDRYAVFDSNCLNYDMTIHIH